MINTEILQPKRISFEVTPPEGYQTRDLEEIVDWDEFRDIFPKSEIDEDEKDKIEGVKIYGAAFISTRCKQVDAAIIAEYDKAAHEEAEKSGGLLYYFKGEELPETRQNVSFCLWKDLESMRRASGLPMHKKAVSIALSAYEKFGIVLFNLTKPTDGEKVIFEKKDLYSENK